MPRKQAQRLALETELGVGCWRGKGRQGRVKACATFLRITNQQHWLVKTMRALTSDESFVLVDLLVQLGKYPVRFISSF